MAGVSILRLFLVRLVILLLVLLRLGSLLLSILFSFRWWWRRRGWGVVLGMFLSLGEWMGWDGIDAWYLVLGRECG